MKLLIESGADPTIANAAGHDAIYEAELNDKKEVVEWVLKEGEGLEEGIGREGEVDEDGEDGVEEGQGGESVEKEEEGVGARLDDLSLTEKKDGS